MGAQKTRSHARAWGVVMVVATSLRVNVSVLIHRMHECEFCRCQARVRGSGACFPGFIEKSAHFGAFWHIFMQFNSLSESFIFSTGKVIKF